MDPALSRLAYTGGNGPCPGGPAVQRPPLCPDNESFEHLATELAGTLALPVDQGAAALGARGFYLGLSSTMTTIRGDQRYWTRGTRGSDPAATRNVDVDSLLVWNRLDVRKGLPFGFEIGSSVGFGIDTSLWVLSAQLKLALFEGYRTGLGALPDIALRAGTQALVGSSELSISTQNLDITLSKPFVVLQQHIVTPLLALQLLFVSARSGVIDLSPGTNSFDACAPGASRGNGVALECTRPEGAAELANNASFRTVNQTRVRLFLGAEERYQLLSLTASMGFDLTTPRLQNETPAETLPTDLMRQFSVHVACGLRY
jgi:hypothetical protein